MLDPRQPMPAAPEAPQGLPGQPPLFVPPPATEGAPAPMGNPQIPSPMQFQAPRSINDMDAQVAQNANKASVDQQRLASDAQAVVNDDTRLKTWESEQLAPVRAEMTGHVQHAINAMQAIHARALDEGTAKIQAVHSAIDEASSQRIDPDSYWEGSTGRKIGLGIALAMGAFANAQSGGRIPNTALQIIQQGIQDNIAAQRARAQGAQNRVGNLQNDYQMFRQQLGDDQSAEVASLGMFTELTNKKIDQMVNAFGGPDAKIAGTKLKLQLAEQSNKAMQDLNNNTIKDYLETMKLRIAQYGMQLKAQAAGGGDTQLRGVTGPRGSTAIEKEQSDRWGSMTAAAEMIDDAVQKMKSGEMSVSDFAEMAGTNPVLHAAIRDGLGMGKRLEGNEGSDMEALTPDRKARLLAYATGDMTGIISKAEAARDALLTSGLRQLMSTNKNLRPVIDPNAPDFDPLVFQAIQRRAAGGQKTKEKARAEELMAPLRKKESEAKTQKSVQRAFIPDGTD